MRTASLLFFLLLVLPLCAAADRPKAASPNGSLSVYNGEAPSWTGIIPTELPNSDSLADPNHRYVSREPQTVTCLKMRTYLMAREGPDSDRTEWVGYTNCQPSAKYGVKFANGR